MRVKLLSQEQANSIQGQQYMPGAQFWWVEDGNKPPNKVLSKVQSDQCTNPDFQWIKDLPEIQWVEPDEPLINSEP